MENTEDIIFRAWHDQAEALLPEFDFTRKQNGALIGRSGLKITGETGEPGKVYYYENTPFLLVDFTRGKRALVAYIKDREGIASTAEALQYMAAAAGVPFKRFKSEEEQRRFEERMKRAVMLEDVNAFFIDSLTFKDSPHAQTPEAAAVRRMLEERGYKREDLREPNTKHSEESPGMEVGFYPSYEALQQHLEAKGYTRTEITETVARILPQFVERTHRLTIPYRNASGQVVGFAFRQTAGTGSAKYLYTSGLKRSDLLFGFRWKKKYTDLVIVEGLLDCMIAHARGVLNVVALGGNQITEAQAQAAVKHCGGSITLCLDNDQAGREGTDAAINTLLEAANAEGAQLKIYIAPLPEGVKDADELITRQGIDAFKKAVDKDAVREIYYWQDAIRSKYVALEKKQGGELTIRQTEALLEEVTRTAAKTRTAVDRERFVKYFEGAFTGIVTQQAIEEEAERLRRDEEQRRQQQEIVNTVNAVNSVIKSGAPPAEALALLKERTERIEVIRGADLIQQRTSKELLEAALQTTPALKTGYAKLDRFFNYEAGAVTLIAGRTSHGKTAFMFNTMLLMAQMPQYADRTFYFFSYEEAMTKLYWKLLNSMIDEDLLDILPPETAGLYAGQYLSNEKMLPQYVRDVQARRLSAVPKIEEARQALDSLIDSGRIVLTDKRLTAEQLEAAIKSGAKRSNFGAAFIDYVQRIRTEGQFKDRRGEIDHISAVLNRAATEADVTLIVGAQLNRQAVSNGKGGDTVTKPRLEHLKESGALEEDANAVLSVYNETADMVEQEGGGAAGGIKEAVLEVAALKSRDGARNQAVQLLFRQHTRRIKELTVTADTLRRQLKEQREQVF